MAANPANASEGKGVGHAGPDTYLRVLATAGFPDYALLDSGDGRKLERFGRFTVRAARTAGAMAAYAGAQPMGAGRRYLQERRCG